MGRKKKIVTTENKFNVWNFINRFYDLSYNSKSTIKDLREKFISEIPDNEKSFIPYTLMKNMLHNDITRLEAHKLIKVMLELGNIKFIETLFLYIKNNKLRFPKFMIFYNIGDKNYDKMIRESFPNVKDEEYEQFKDKYNFNTSRELYQVLNS